MAKKVDDYIKRAEDILKKNLTTKGKLKKGGVRIEFKLKDDTVAEARLLKKRIQQAQKELRQVKREINADMKAVRAEYKQKASRVQPSTGSMILSGISLGRGKGRRKGGLSSSVADQKRKLNQERDRLLSPYDSVKLGLDNILVQLDQGKISVDAWIAENK